MMQKVAFLNEFSEGSIISKEVQGKKIALVKIKEQIFAFDNECTHEHFPLSDGSVVDSDRAIIECAYHGARFSLNNGKVMALPATQQLKVYKIEVKDREIWADI